MPEEVVQPVLGHANPDAPEKTEALQVLTPAASELANHSEAESAGKFSIAPQGERLGEFFGLETTDVDGWEQLMRYKVKHFDSTKPL